MTKVVPIYEKTFRQEYCWVRAKNSSEFEAYLRTKISNYDQVVDTSDNSEEDDGETLSLVIDGRGVIFFWFNEEDITAIVHELLHAVCACMRSRGVTLTEDSEETFCYALSFLMTEVDKVLKKPLTKKKKAV